MAGRSNDDIWERLGALGAGLDAVASGVREIKEKIQTYEEAQSEHRRRLYDRMDVHDDRIGAIEAAHREMLPKVERMHIFVDQAEIVAAKADGRKEFIVQSVSIGGKAWAVIKPTLLAAAIVAAAVWRDLVEAFGAKPPHP